MTASQLSRVMRLPGRAPHVYAVLLRLAHERGTDTVEAGAGLFKYYHTGPLAFYRARDQLIKAKLIEVEKVAGQLSRFRLLHEPGRPDGTIIDIPYRLFEFAMEARGSAYHAFLLAWELAKSTGDWEVILRRDLHYQYGLTSKTLKLALRELRRHVLAETWIEGRWRIMVRVRCRDIPYQVGDTHTVEDIFSFRSFAAGPITDDVGPRMTARIEPSNAPNGVATGC